MNLTAAVAAGLLRNRHVVRAPIPLYRHGFGWLMGSRILMLEHVGRSTGQPRYVCLEVVERCGPHTAIVVSGFGERSQWYQNLRATPDCHVSWARRRRVPAHARFLPDEESAAVLERYQRVHPRAWSRLHDAIEQAVGHPMERLPMVELTLTTGP